MCDNSVYTDALHRDRPDPASAAAEEALRVARVTLESFVHQQTPTKTLSGEAHGQLARLVDALIDAARSGPASPGGLDPQTLGKALRARGYHIDGMNLPAIAAEYARLTEKATR